jgi:hypothetical protein
MTIPRMPVITSESLSVSLGVTSVTEAQAARVSRPPEAWTAADVAEYITEEVVRVHGPQLPARDVQETLRGFCERFGVPAAVRIARAAFEIYSGFWEGAPVTWKRFGPGHDEFFAQPILAALG